MGNCEHKQTGDLSGGAILVFVCLQALDVITTLLGLRLGAQEANFFISRLMDFGPATGLLLAKLAGLVIVAMVFLLRKFRLIRLLNLWFAGIVTWNLVMIWLQRLTAT